MTDAAQDANLPMECWPGQAELGNTLQEKKTKKCEKIIFSKRPLS